MNQIYVRSDKVKELIYDVKLHIPEWKVLFAVNGKRDTQSLASFLELPESDVVATLEKLKEMQLVTSLEVASEPTAETPPEELMEEGGEEETSEASFGFMEEPELSDQGLMDQPEMEFDVATESDIAEAMEQGEADTVTAEDELQSEEEEEETFPAVEESSEEDELDELIGDLLDETETEEETTESPMEDLSTPEEEAGLGEDLDLDDLFEETPELESEESVEELGSTSEDFETPPAEAEAAFPEETTTIEDMQVSIDETELFEPQTEEATEAPEAPPEVETPPETGERPTVLVVDDSVVIRKMVEIALENENLNIVSVATGKEALNYLDENTPNVIILDIMLSDMNGLDVLKAIKASKDIPVVMLSAKDTPRETTKAKQLGADDFIPKPFKDEELVAKIKELVQKSA